MPLKTQAVSRGLARPELFIAPPLPAVFMENVQWVRIGEVPGELLFIPPPVPAEEFPVNVQELRVGDEDRELAMPPPLLVAVLAENAQLVSRGAEEASFIMPPPERVEFEMNVQSVSTGEASWL